MKQEIGMITVVGMGPGDVTAMTGEALAALRAADVLVGYPVYLDLLPEEFREKEWRSTPMKQEVERCAICFEEAARGKCVALVCSGDAGVYGLASLMYEMKASSEYAGVSCEIRVIPGVTAANSGAAVLGAPLNHDFCCISLSDLLTPWEVIERRLRAAAEGDFAIAIYNPASRHRPDHLRRACGILREHVGGDRACGYVRNIGREGTKAVACTLDELAEAPIDMFTTVFIGSSNTKILDGRLITPRGYLQNVQGVHEMN